ncbi:hypothetical protein BH23CHL7_BH23CHL7_20340 [soil metagenome]
MPFVPPALFAAAVTKLAGAHPLGVVVVPAMVRAGVTVVTSADDGHPYGADDEGAVLRDYFRLAGGPPGKPFRAIWEENPKFFWRDELYAGRSLQRIRKGRVDANRAFYQKKEKPKDRWGLRASAGVDLLASDVKPIALADLAIWYGRDEDVADIQALLQWFLAEFPLDQGDLVGTVYTSDLPTEYGATTHPFSTEPLDLGEIAQVVGAAPPPPEFTGGVADLATRVETCVLAKGFIASPRFVARVVSAWLRGDVVILVGQPGTGKTYFSNLIGECLREVLEAVSVTKIPVRSDFDESDLLGYEGLDGKPHLREFAKDVLQSDEPLGTHLVILDEFNLASVETYLSSVLIAIEDIERKVVLPGGESSFLPVDTFVLATCNSYLDEPESRLRVSFPTKRRASVIAMPNVLHERYEANGAGVFVDEAVQLISKEADLIRQRVTEGRGTGVDRARLDALATVASPGDLSRGVVGPLNAVCTSVMETPEGRKWLTLGVLKDVALAIAYAGRDEEAERVALGESILEKLLPQLRGPKERAAELASAVASLPNAKLITEQLELMQSGPTDEILATV